MLDPDRLNPDGSDDLHLFSINDGWFPLLDERGYPTGLLLKLLTAPAAEYLLSVDIPASEAYGVDATLAVQLERVTYLNGFHLEPAANFPARLKSIEADGLVGATRAALWSGDVVLDRPLSIRFDRRQVRCLYLHFSQTNYRLNEHVVSPADTLRRQALVALQGSLPFSLRRLHVSPGRTVSGAQYDFAFTGLRGEDWHVSMPQDRGVFLSGPYTVEGTPEILRFDADFAGDVRFYLLDAPYDQNETLIGSSQGEVQLVPGQAFSYTPPPTVAQLSKVAFTVKIVLRDPFAVVERFLFEATAV
jgi:hypothetical protein